jgi:rhamnogalacturonan endolyase
MGRDRIVRAGALAAVMGWMIWMNPFTCRAQRQIENIDRGLLAVKVSHGVYLSWRVLGEEYPDAGYNLYRESGRLNAEPITGATCYLDNSGDTGIGYAVAAVIDGVEQAKSDPVTAWGSNFREIPIQRPPGGTTPDGVSYTYNANDLSVGDLDGDGQYEMILKWDPSNSKDNSQGGYTGKVFLDAYEMDGTRLWRIDLGINIRAGAHYTQFMVYDLDGDGKAEVACKTADGTTDGTGTVIGDAGADYRTSSGYNRLHPRQGLRKQLGRQLREPGGPFFGMCGIPGRATPEPGHVPGVLYPDGAGCVGLEGGFPDFPLGFRY